MGEPASFADVLAARRMCRDFSGEPVPSEVLEVVLRAAFRGPSAGNTDAVSLLVLEGARVQDYWATTLSPQRRAEFPWPGLLRAPVLVVPYVDPEQYVDRYAEPDKELTGLGSGTDAWPVPYWWVDGGAAVMAMLLAAEDVGLGVLFFGQFDHEGAVMERFGVPTRLRALGTLALGVRGDGASTSASVRRRPRSDPGNRVHRQQWRSWADG